MSRTRGTGLIILALIGALDIAGLAGFFIGNAPPAWVMLTGAALGLATLIGTGLAFTGRRGGLTIAVTTRVIAAVFGLGAFTDAAAPDWSKVVIGIAIALTVAGVALIAVGRRPATAFSGGNA